jgi:hypothetical protein
MLLDAFNVPSVTGQDILRSRSHCALFPVRLGMR